MVNTDMKRTSYFLVLLILVSVCKGDRSTGSGGHQGYNLAKQVEDIYKDCDYKKAVCVGMPNGCVSSGNCKSIVTIVNDGSKLAFRLLDTSDQQNFDPHYVAVGISKNGKNMENTTIFACSTDVNQPMSLYWSVKATTQSIYQVDDADYVKAKEPSSFNADGKLYCSFYVNYVFTEHGVKFDLKNQKYAVLLAKGPTKEHGHIDYHRTDKELFPPILLSSASLAQMSFALSLLSLTMAILMKV